MQKLLTACLLALIAGGVCLGEEKPRTAADGPFVPEVALAGGMVLPLYPAKSPMLISVCAMICRLSAARITLRNTG